MDIDYEISCYKVYLTTIGYNGGLIHHKAKVFYTEEEAVEWALKQQNRFDYFDFRIEQIRNLITH